MRLETRLYKSISSYSSETLDYVIENGKNLYLDIMGGSGALMPSVKCEIIWDAGGTPEILFCTHGCVPAQPTTRHLEGDGSKILRIKLTNDSSYTETIGAFWMGWVS